jgi:predicted ATPase/DNA-binding SARP family transcriptional activator
VSPLWRIELLGGLRIAGSDRVITRFRTQKVAALLAFLAYHQHRSHSREELAELLWPEGDPEASRRSLRVALASLRHQLEPPDIAYGTVLVASHASVRLNPNACVTDVARFEAAFQAAARADDTHEKAQRLAEAVESYRGELLPGHFDDWILPERERLLEAYVMALGELAAVCEKAGDLPGAIQWARRAVGADPLREEVHRGLICLLTAAGQPEAALRQYRDLERLLRHELRAAPEAALRALARELEAQVAAVHLLDLPAPGAETPIAAERPCWSVPVNPVSPATPSPATSAGAGLDLSGYLPPQFTRFFGREAEIARLEALRCGGPVRSRLVTLTGPGGTGKTRLALEAAARVRQRFEGTLGFVPLVDLSDSGLIAGQILDALRVPRSSGTPPFEQVVAVLSSSGSLRQSTPGPSPGAPALLLLDNFEHLLPEGAAVVQALLERVETLSLWVTSRQSLGLPGERELPVGPLEVPGAGSEQGPSDLPHPATETLMRYPSVQLFVDRAQEVRPDFQLTAANATAVARLCAGLEGLPLAIILAAARSGVLTPEQMLSRLADTPGAGGRFDLLTTRRRTADRRHQSLRTALDWSYHLLSPELQRFFARLSVFRGGWTLEAAAAILDWEAGVDPSAIQNPKSKIQNWALECLQQLRECSLVLAEEGPRGMRYRLLETLREYGQERLLEAGEAEAIAERHARYFLGLVEQAEPELMRFQQAEWLARLDEEHDNVRAALAWCRSTPDRGEMGLRMVGALFWFWWIRCYHSEGRRQAEGILASTGGAPGIPASEAWTGAPHRTAARAKACRCGGGMVWAQGSVDEARPLMEEAVAIARELGDPGFLALSLRFLGWVALDQQDYEVARSVMEESLDLHRQTNNQVQIGRSLNFLATLARAQGDFQTAGRLWEEVSEVSLQAGDLWAVAISLANLARLQQIQGDLEAARSLFEQALNLRREIGDVRGIAECLEGFAELASATGEMQRAARLFGSADALRKAVGGPPLPIEWPAARESAIAPARTQLGEKAFAAAWEQGRRMTLEQSISEAIELRRV